MLEKLVVCGTGHRPDKLDNSWSVEHSISRSIQRELYSWLKLLLSNTRRLKVIVGGALGFDTHLALSALKLKSKNTSKVFLELALPHRDFSLRWSEEDRRVLDIILTYADRVHYVSNNKDFNITDLELRNRYMVRKSELVIALWDGSKGGTRNAFVFADRNSKPIIWLKPKEFGIYTGQGFG